MLFRGQPCAEKRRHIRSVTLVTNQEYAFAFEVNRVLKSEGIFLICNESDGTNAADEKWTKMINGMKIYTSKQLVAALKEAGFTEIKTYSNVKNHWISIVATK